MIGKAELSTICGVKIKPLFFSMLPRQETFEGWFQGNGGFCEVLLLGKGNLIDVIIFFYREM